MKEAMDQIVQVCKSFFEDIVRIRRDFHMHPEIGFDVYRTADIVGMELQKLGMKVRKGIGKTGVVGDMEVPGATKRIALRPTWTPSRSRSLERHLIGQRWMGRGTCVVMMCIQPF